MTSKTRQSSETKSLLKSAGKFSFGVFVSRVLGLIREIVYAALYGAGGSMDTFRTAYIIPGMILEFISEGTMNAAFIPVFSDVNEKEGKKKAFAFAVNLLNILIFLSGVLCALGIIFAPYIVSVFAGGYSGEKQTQTVFLVKILFPILIISSSTSLVMGLLNYFRHYSITSLAPALWNLVSIMVTLFLFKVLKGSENLSPVPLAAGILAGSIAQFAVMLPASVKEGFRYRLSVHFNDISVRRSLFLFLPVALGYVATRINVAVNQAFATHMGDGAVSHYSFAFRLMTFPLGIVGVSLATVALPETARHASSMRTDLVLSVLTKSLRLAMFFVFPVCALMWVLRYHLVRIIYQHGMFTPSDTAATADVLGWFLLGIAGTSFVKILSNTFYSMKDTKIPVAISFLSSALNVFTVLAVRQKMGINGLAFSVSLASIFNSLCLLSMFHLRYAKVSFVNLSEGALKTLFSSVLPASAIYIVLRLSDLLSAHFLSFKLSLAVSAASSITFLVFYLATARALRFRASTE
ncbi:murein biosynthesis integral membrane protein MurJ [candidate division WOR-3 bacterium]|nr:murein biosynthesis integral membrane protein MurJ [candidate division WOR-3 bacterium]